MDTETLLKPRWKVIADFPDSDFKVGSIEDRDWCKYKNGEDESDGILWQISEYPHLFRKLQWWEERSVDEMPEYVKDKESGQVYKIKDWDNFSAPYVFIDDNIHVGYRKGCEYTPLFGEFIPSTFEEYQKQPQT